MKQTMLVVALFSTGCVTQGTYDALKADHDPGQGLQKLALIAHPRIAGAHAAPELRIIPAERLLNLLQLALLVFWERHDASPTREPCAELLFGNYLMYPFVF